ncbi:DUF5681 domain-containing protein [Methylosinus trichosporium]|uniref:DUF5681 domain-containing protein n=2 Tax=Methylosinus TaxID=425 RepID=A0A2D2D194_METT3|nr:MULTISPECIES: DUF5681 domain-containing protein [Methylosinus]ATQ68734.1 hypothetical protein CQW49_13215 [Methylosinus trichosporium OB3b]OBS53107.1 hypothetical protein A8B73_07300 [Methylosinus sp. 3S-1]
MSTDNSDKKQGGGRFQKGQSGNPRGKPKGARHRATILAEALLDGEAEKLTRKAIELALDGDGVALRLCLERIAPPRKDRPVGFPLPNIERPADAVAASAAILAAVAQGDLTPDEAERVLRLLAEHVKIVETTELEERLKRLEERTGL